jgi:glutamyl-tRNA synthetase
MRRQQKAQKINFGYYGEYAKCRNLTYEQVREKIDAGVPFVLRLKSNGSSNNKIKFTDLIKGTIEITENDIDHILLKSNGMPDYHLAHAVDDHLMHTTHVVRGEEWLPSLPYHIQLFNAFDFKLPK